QDDHPAYVPVALGLHPERIEPLVPERGLAQRNRPPVEHVPDHGSLRFGHVPTQRLSTFMLGPVPKLVKQTPINGVCSVRIMLNRFSETEEDRVGPVYS